MIAIYVILVLAVISTYIVFLHLFTGKLAIIPHILFIILAYFMVFLGVFIFSLIMAFHKEIYMFNLKERIKYVYSLFGPLVIMISRLLKIHFSKIQLGLVELNNAWVLAYLKHHKPKRILFETPICLQSRDCPHNIITNINNCKECGNCQVCDLLKISREFNIETAIFTGGQLAIKMVKDFKPDLIVAVACEKELMEDIPQVYPYIAYGIINIRKNGPCINTKFDYEFTRNLFISLCGNPVNEKESKEESIPSKAAS